jgi:hypothetical protein
MKMKRTTMTWEKTVSVVLYVPEDMDDHSIRFIAENIADDIDREGWDVSWETHVSRAEAFQTRYLGETVADTSRTTEPVQA